MFGVEREERKTVCAHPCHMHLFTNLKQFPCDYDSKYIKNANIDSCNNKVSEIDNNGSCFKRKKIDVQTSRYISTFSKGEKKVDKNKYCNTILEND